MSSVLHIDSLSDDAYQQLEKEAAAHGLSPADWAARVLASRYMAGEQEIEPSLDKRSAIRQLFGTWSEEQVREFMDATADTRRIDEAMWK